MISLWVAVPVGVLLFVLGWLIGTVNALEARSWR